MDAAALDRHEADALRSCRLRDVVDREPGGPFAGLAPCSRRPHHRSELSAVVGVLVGELGGREHVLGVDHQQEIVVGLKVNVPGAGRRGQIGDRLRSARVAHVDHAEPLGEHVPDIGVAAMHHDLDAVGSPALVAPADQAQVVRVVRLRQIGAHRCAARKFGTAIQSIIASCCCSSFHIRRSSSVLRSTPRWVPSLRPCSMMRSPIGCRRAL